MGGVGGIADFMWFVIGEILLFVMREFKILFSVICDGSIAVMHEVLNLFFMKHDETT